MGRIAVIPDKPVKVDISVPRTKYDAGEEFVATVRVTSYEEEPQMVAFLGPIVGEAVSDETLKRLEISELDPVDPFTLTRDNRSRSFPVAMKAVKAGLAVLRSEISFASSGGQAETDLDQQQIVVDPLGISIAAMPQQFALNQMAENRMSGGCIALQGASGEEAANCVEITLSITNISDQVVTDIFVPDATNVLRLISSRDLENPGVPLTPLRFVPHAGTAAKPESFSLQPGEVARFIWNVSAFDAPADLKLKGLVTAGIAGKPIQSGTEGSLKIVDEPLLKWGVRPFEGRTSYQSGQGVRVEGFLENVSLESGEGRDLLVLFYQIHEGNLGGGFMVPSSQAGSTPGQYFIFELPAEGEGRRVSTSALFRSFRTWTPASGTVRYAVSLWVRDEEGRTTRATEQALLDDDWLDSFQVQFAAEPPPPDTYRDECRQAGIPAWLCGMSQGIYFEAAEGIYGLLEYASKAKDEFKNAGGMLLAHNAWLSATLWDAVRGDEGARAALLQELYVEYLTYVNLGVMAGEGVSNLPMAFEAFSVNTIGAVDNFFRAIHQGNLEEVQFQVGKFFGANPDLLFEPLVVANTYFKLNRAIRSTATELTDNVVAAAVREKATREKLSLRERLAIAEADPNVTDLASVLRAGDEIDDGLLARIYGISSEQRAALQEFCRKHQIIATFRSRHPRALQLLKDKLAWPKPQALKWKTVSDIDVEFLGYRPEALARIELMEPPASLLGKQGEELESALDAYMEGLKGKHQKLVDNDVLAAEVRERLRMHKEYWEKLSGEHKLGDQASSIKVGLNFDEPVQFADRAGIKPGITESRTVSHTPIGGQVDPVTGAPRRAWELKMSGPNGAPSRHVAGDIDFLSLLEPNGGIIRDKNKRIRMYKELAALLDMQHGESYTFFLQKARVEHLRCCTEGGEAMVTISPIGNATPTAGYFVDNLSIFDDGPNTSFLGRRKPLTDESGTIVLKDGKPIEIRREDPTGEFVLINGMQTADSVKYGFINRFVPLTFSQSIAGFLKRLPFYFPSYIERLLNDSDEDARATLAGHLSDGTLSDLRRPLAQGVTLRFEVDAPLLQAGAASAEDPRGLESLRVWNRQSGWRPVSGPEAIGLGLPGVADVAPMSVLAAGMDAGETVLPVLPQAELGVPGRFFQAGDLVVIDPGGLHQEFAIVAVASPLTMVRPLSLAHDSGETVSWVESSASDQDGDGLSDRHEASLGTQAGSRDTDGDGFTDGIELTLGTNPLESTSHLRLLSVEPGDGVVTLSWSSVPGKSYIIEVSFDPTLKAWGSLQSVEAHPNGIETSTVVTPEPGVDQFYRVRLGW